MTRPARSGSLTTITRRSKPLSGGAALGVGAGGTFLATLLAKYPLPEPYNSILQLGAPAISAALLWLLPRVAAAYERSRRMRAIKHWTRMLEQERVPEEIVDEVRGALQKALLLMAREDLDPAVEPEHR
jgi:hypothetical protein